MIGFCGFLTQASTENDCWPLAGVVGLEAIKGGEILVQVLESIQIAHDGNQVPS